MNADLGMIGQKVLDEFGFRDREIVSDDMDLAPRGREVPTWASVDVPHSALALRSCTSPVRRLVRTRFVSKRA